MMTALVLLLVGISLSAFFSGTETGFYRVTRVRLVLDTLDGDLISRCLLWFTNNPTLFVATVLIGNNLANYLASLAIVLGVHSLAAGQLPYAELLATIGLAPLVFLYGELIPKRLYYDAPSRLLRRGGILFLLFSLLSAPAVCLLWLMGRAVQGLIGETPLRIQATLARTQLQDIFQQGEEVGILKPIQRQLSEGLFNASGKTVESVATPVGRVASISSGSTRQEVIRLARRQRLPWLTVSDPETRRVEGYVRLIDLELESAPSIHTARPLIRIPRNEPLLQAIIRMQNEDEELAGVVDGGGTLVGLVTCQQLADLIFQAKPL